jgi:hypothetical protein
MRRRIRRHVARLLHEGESVLAAGFEHGGGVLTQRYVLLTADRLLVVSTGLGLGGSGLHGTEAIPLKSVLSVDTTRQPGLSSLIGAPLRLNTGGGVIELRVSPTRVADLIAAHLRESLMPHDDVADSIERLTVLYKKGLISSNEYEERRRKILDRL